MGYGSSLQRTSGSSVCLPPGRMETSTSSEVSGGYATPVPPMAPRLLEPSARVDTGSAGGALRHAGSAPRSSGLRVEDFMVGGGHFDPTLPQTKKQLTAKLGVSSSSMIEELKGFRGGLNEGVWFLSDPARRPGEELALKLVTAQRKHEVVPTEAEKFVALYREEPQIARDPVIAFPICIFNLVGQNGSRRYDLIVMPKAPGESVSVHLAYMFGSGRFAEMNQLFHRIGSLLKGFHDRHGDRQHGDFTTANILYDEPSGALTLIDASTIDCMVSSKGLCQTETDCQRFEKALGLLSREYGPQFFADGMHHFQAGYGGGSSTAGGGGGANGARQRVARRSVAVPALAEPMVAAGGGEWSQDQTFRLPPGVAASPQVTILDENAVSSVSGAVELLNRGAFRLPAEMCICWSLSNQCHYLLWKRGHRAKALAACGLCEQDAAALGAGAASAQVQPRKSTAQRSTTALSPTARRGGRGEGVGGSEAATAAAQAHFGAPSAVFLGTAASTQAAPQARTKLLGYL